MRIRLCCAFVTLLSVLAARAQPDELPACNPLQVARAVSAAEELLTTPQGNLRALRCVDLIDERADIEDIALPRDIRRRLAVIASNAIDQANGSATVGTAGGYNAQAARLWLRLAAADDLDVDDRRTAVLRLIEHGRYAGFEAYLPQINALTLSLGRRLPSGFTLLLSSTLYRCPQWTRPQASNRIAASDVPCHSGCSPAAQTILDTASSVLDGLSVAQRSSAEMREYGRFHSLLQRRTAACAPQGRSS